MYQLPLIQKTTTRNVDDHYHPKTKEWTRLKVFFLVMMLDTCLFIGNLDKRCTEDKLQEICKGFGPFEYCYIVFEPTSHYDRNRETKISRGYGFVKYQS